MERKVYVLQWARKKEKKKYHETVAQMMQRERFLLGGANFLRACASLQCARIPETLTITPRHDYNGILPPSENFLSLSEYCILFTSICVILSAGKKYGGEGVRGGGCGVVFSSTSCQGHQAIWSWAKFTLNYRLRKRSRHIPALWPPLLQPWGSRLATSTSHSKSQPGDPPKSESPKI